MLSAAARRLNSRSSASLRGRPPPRASAPRRTCSRGSRRGQMRAGRQQGTWARHQPPPPPQQQSVPGHAPTSNAPAQPAHPAQRAQQDQRPRRREAGGGEEGGGAAERRGWGGARRPGAAHVAGIALLVVRPARLQLRVRHGRGARGGGQPGGGAQPGGRGGDRPLRALRHAARIKQQLQRAGAAQQVGGRWQASRRAAGTRACADSTQLTSSASLSLLLLPSSSSSANRRCSAAPPAGLAALCMAASGLRCHAAGAGLLLGGRPSGLRRQLATTGEAAEPSPSSSASGTLAE